MVKITLELQTMLIPPGDDGLTEYSQRYNPTNTTKAKRKNDEAKLEDEVTLLGQMMDNFRIYFPTEETVLTSKGGPSVSPSDITLRWAPLIIIEWRNDLPSIEVVQFCNFSSKLDARLQESTYRLAYAQQGK